MTFAETLKAHREIHGLSQPALAKFLGVSPRSVWEWENRPEPTQAWEHKRSGILAKLASVKAPKKEKAELAK